MSRSSEDQYVQFVNARLRRFSESATIEDAPADVLDEIDKAWFATIRRKTCRTCKSGERVVNDCEECRMLSEYGLRKPKTSTQTLVKDIRRLETMAARAARGESLHHPSDTLATNDSITRVTYSGSSGGAGRTTLKKATSPKMSPRYSN